LDRRVVVGLVAGCVAAFAGFAGSFHPDVLVVRPSATIDVSGDVAVSVAGAAAHPPRGRYVVTAVDIEQTTLIGLGLAVVRGEEVVPRAHGVTSTEDSRVGRETYLESQRVAASLVTRRAGLDPAVVEVRFRDRSLTGPSAGLLYALVIADMTDVVAVPEGRVVAATGELDGSGLVRPVGFLDVKRKVARRAGATIFLVPPGGRALAPGAVSVATLDEALRAVGS
jgi:PDZ domain-containing protein